MSGKGGLCGGGGRTSLRTGVAGDGQWGFFVQVAVQEGGEVRGADLERGPAAAEVVVELGGDGSVGGGDVAFQDA